jgi:DNA (cytosine-5)-methyltransferase 1
MKYLSVCSGIEAATKAWHPMGWQPFAFSEIESFPSAVLEYHYPQVPNLGDMTKFKEWPDANIDVLVGGTPCQSFSVAGLRKGLDDPRGNLMLTYLAIARRYQPQWLVWENVPGVLSSNGGRDFGTFLGGLAELGYGFAYRVLDAQYVRTQRFRGAVPQRRRRVFVVGYFGDWRRAAAVLFDAESLSGNPPPRREAGQRTAGLVANCLRGRSNASHRADSDNYYIGTPLASNALCARDYKGARPEADQGAPLVVAHSLRGEGFDASEYGTGRGTPLVPVAPTIGSGAPYSKTGNARVESDALVPIAFGWQNSPSQGDSASTEITPTLDKSKTPAVAFAQNTRDEVRLIGGDGSVVGALAAEPGMKQTSYVVLPQGCLTPELPQRVRVHSSEGVSPTLASEEGRGHGVPTVFANWAVRRLTPRECERLQGFPDDFTQIPYRGKPADKCPDGPRYKALGNSMAVNCMEWIGQRIQAVSKLAKSEAAA